MLSRQLQVNPINNSLNESVFDDFQPDGKWHCVDIHTKLLVNRQRKIGPCHSDLACLTNNISIDL